VFLPIAFFYPLFFVCSCSLSPLLRSFLLYFLNERCYIFGIEKLKIIIFLTLHPEITKDLVEIKPLCAIVQGLGVRPPFRVGIERVEFGDERASHF